MIKPLPRSDKTYDDVIVEIQADIPKYEIGSYNDRHNSPLLAIEFSLHMTIKKYKVIKRLTPDRRMFISKLEGEIHAYYNSYKMVRKSTEPIVLTKCCLCGDKVYKKGLCQKHWERPKAEVIERTRYIEYLMRERD